MSNKVKTIEAINRFLLNKKEKGLGKEKINLYLNLLKYFSDYLDKSNLEISKLKTPVETINSIKFEGLNKETEDEYKNLFFEFTVFCRKTLVEEEVSIAETKEPVKNPIPSVASNEEKEEYKIKAQKKKQHSEQTTQTREQNVQNESTSYEGNKYNQFIFYGLIAAGISLLIILVFFATRETQEGLSLADRGIDVRIDVDKSELALYASEMEKYTKNLYSVINSWRRTKKNQINWQPEYESVLVNAKLLLDKLNDIECPQELLHYHKTFIEKNDMLVKELENVKFIFSSKFAIVGAEQRKGRKFNSVNVLIGELKEHLDLFNALIKGVCKHNKIVCSI